MYVEIVVYMVTVCRALGNETNSSVVLVENLRRQLMYENYDYMPTDTDEITHNTRRTVPNKTEITLESFNIFIPRAAPDPARAKHDTGQAAVRHDRAVKHLYKKMITFSTKKHDDSQNTVTTHKPKYKIIKISNPNRRSMGARRFIQEESDAGVAIFSLDDGPLPEFRLPKTRRQYMHDPDEVDDSQPDLDFTDNRTNITN